MTDRRVIDGRVPRIVVVGFGPVAARLVDELLPAVRAGRLALTVLGEEAHAAYNRVLVADLGVGRTTVDAMMLAEPAELAAAGVDVRLRTAVRHVDRARKLVRLEDGTAVGYDRLVFATGARAVVPNLHGLNPDPHTDPGLPAGVIALRDVADAAVLRRAVTGGHRIVVLGGGILGLEAALAAADEGAEVTIVHHGPHTLARSIDAGAGHVLSATLRARGVRIVADARSTAVTLRASGDGTASFAALKLDDGQEIPGDLLLLSCGVRPRIELAEGAGLATDRGILVDHGLAAHHDEDVFAIGDCAEIRCLAAGCAECAAAPSPSGLIGPGWRQAEHLAARLLRPVSSVQALPAEPAPVMLLKARGVDVAAAGDVTAGPFDDACLDGGPLRVSQWADPEHGRYVKMVTRGGVLAGLVCVGLPRTAAELVLLYERGAELPADRSVLLRLDGPDRPPAGAATAGAADPARTVCRCAGVGGAAIDAAVADGCASVADVAARTRAGTGCGGCHGDIRARIEAHFQPAVAPR
ncbi:FAD-dependent oxidoreductase [Specibacter cremeus]|uniref:FAD-dependent oxidoreductase n=1 Tax=Specibacter cremeus TaxID=1629051 RepID=UPI000F7794C4|nr:FAD-dependent oxidoreductase [Specibacter cremeus]